MHFPNVLLTIINKKIKIQPVKNFSGTIALVNLIALLSGQISVSKEKRKLKKDLVDVAKECNKHSANYKLKSKTIS